MRKKPIALPRLRDEIYMTLEATFRLIRAMLLYRMGLVLPMVLVLVLVAYAGMILGLVSPLAVVPRSVQVTPFIYPLF